MTTQHDVVALRSDAGRCPPLRITEVLPPEPHHGPGTYDVRLALSRPLTVHERQALPRLAKRLLPIRDQLVVCDTTLERVGARAAELAALMETVERAGRKLEEDVRARAEASAEAEEQERQRLRALALSIRFPA
jgi:hypothetical protein